jgi:hypothetical protein
MKEPMTQFIAVANVKASGTAFRHYVAHYQAALATKTLPKEVINPEKSFVADYEKAINALKEQMAEQEQMAQQAQPQAQLPMQ